MGRGEGRRARLRTLVLAAAVLLAMLAVHDFRAPAGHGFAARAALTAIDQYRTWVSPHIKQFAGCRFTPGCARYTRASIEKHGFIKGAAKGAWRLARCGPWTPAGTVDPP
jgi:putative component of membrane protein insertase Oxa1/YidC/SpoIIIJ protein YidD